MEQRALGPLQLLTLATLAGLPSGSGTRIEIQRKVIAASGQTRSQGAIHVTLDRLAQKGLVRTRMGPPTPRRGGRSSRLYTITPEGAEVLERDVPVVPAPDDCRCRTPGCRNPGTVVIQRPNGVLESSCSLHEIAGWTVAKVASPDAEGRP